MQTPNGLVLNVTEAAAYRAIAAQNFVAGNVLGWFGVSSGWQNSMGLADPDAAFVRSLASIKASNAKYLTHGRLWRPVQWITSPPLMWLHDYGYMEHDPHQGCPTAIVLAECWRAADGSFALVAANHGSTANELDIIVDMSESEESPGSGHTVRLTRSIPALTAFVLPL